MRRPSVHVRSKRQHLFFDFKWQGERCKEYTGLLDTTENRTRCQRMARIMSEEMDLETFEYLRHFPEGSRKYKFTGRPDNNVTLRQYAENDWLAHIKTKVREKTAEEYLNDILIPRVFPSLGDISLKDIRPEHLDHFTGHLKTLTWHRSLPIGTQEIEGRPLSPRRINIILLRVRQILDLAYERGYIPKNPHGWITLQKRAETGY